MMTRKNPTNNAKKVHLDEVLFEFQRVGNILRVTAIDPITGTEVISVADPRYGEHEIKKRAASKLAYVITKNQNKHKT